jgi:streptogramin lyase
MLKLAQKMSWVFLALVFMVAGLTAADTGFHGVVTDDAGKPVRGAIVKATQGFKSVIRYSQGDGRYDMTLPPGSYSVGVEAFGFGAKRLTKDASATGDTNFTLAHKLDLTRMSGADLENLLPDTMQSRLIVAECIECHGIENIMHKSGFKAGEWDSFIPTMTRGKVVPPRSSPAITAALEKYFGPDSPYFGPDADPPKPEQLKHVEISDEALNATIREYAIPTGLPAMPHSIMVDGNDDAWFSERGIGVYKIGRFESRPEKFDEYTVPLPENGAANPHTGVIGKDGTPWMSLIHDNRDAKGPDLAQVDPETGKVTTYTIPDAIKHLGVHTLAVAPDGSIWMSGSSVWRFDVKTKVFKEYKVQLPSVYPETSIANWTHAPGDALQPAREGRTTFYDIRVDSKGKVWASAGGYGYLSSIDPVTGETKEYHPPETNLIKGVEIDGQDNVWFAAFHSNVLGKLDQKTGKFSIYHFPTRFAMPYGLSVDRRTGDIWAGDMNGQHVTRFDPKTEHFTEFPVPLSRPKFLGIDSKSRIWFTEYLDGKIGVLDTGEGSKRVSTQR